MVVSALVNNVLNNTDGFTNNNGVSSNNNVVVRQPNMLVLLIVASIYFILVLLVGKYLWNECLCKVVTICKPIDNVFTLLGVILIIDMLHPKL